MNNLREFSSHEIFFIKLLSLLKWNVTISAVILNELFKWIINSNYIIKFENRWSNFTWTGSPVVWDKGILQTGSHGFVYGV